MPRFEVRLESPDLTKNGKPCYRITRLVAEDADAAAAQCRRKEFQLCAYQIVDAAGLAVLEAQEEAGELRGTAKAQLLAHRQVEPYAVVSVTEIGKE